MRDPTPRRPQISRAYLEEHRRRRYAVATAELLHEFGRDGPTVTNIVRRAGTSRASFYEVFGGAEDCIAFGVGLAARELFASLEAQGGQGSWLLEVQEAISGFYQAVAATPPMAELFLIHSAVSRREQVREAARESGGRFAALFGRGRAESEAMGRPTPPPLLEEYLSRGIVFLAARRVGSERVAALPAEGGPMARLVGGYFIGSRRAAELLADDDAGTSALSDMAQGPGPRQDQMGPGRLCL